ncbi:DUF2087 domain-containing protein [Candidatus Woesearchaeota archaeon]|nr:DUF2087 domain-containing protein [Candidatus Woesearchaeota archaeon]
MAKVEFNLDEDKFFEKSVKNKNFPKNDALKQVILKKITAEFEKNKIYSEQEVNSKIKKYFEDNVLIRRELINFGYMQRDPAKAEYWVIKYELSKEDFLKIDRLKRHAKELGIID